METLILGVLLFIPTLDEPLVQGGGEAEPSIGVRIELSDRGEIDVGTLIERIGRAIGAPVRRPSGTLAIPARGVGGALAKSTLEKSLGSKVVIQVDDRALVIELKLKKSDAAAVLDIRERLETLARRVEREGNRRQHYGMHALKSYRPNDPSRPTICLIHGMNSTSGVFVHMFGPLQEAGYGIVVYDFPYNRSLRTSASEFVADWRAFRRSREEKRPWVIVAHSMGSLLARAYAEDEDVFGNDVSSMILIAPVNGGSRLAKAQTLLQLRKGLQAVSGETGSDALAQLGDGLGEAATDLTPGSPFLQEINSRRRIKGVPYHILAGDQGFLSRATRSRLEAAVGNQGLLSSLSRFAAGSELPFDEVSEGTGDGCVAVERTKLEGVADHVVIRANHLELIRAPLLYPDPGPVASMPFILERLSKEAPVTR